jgi:hypothetical protein
VSIAKLQLRKEGDTGSWLCELHSTKQSVHPSITMQNAFDLRLTFKINQSSAGTTVLIQTQPACPTKAFWQIKHPMKSDFSHSKQGDFVQYFGRQE